MILDSAVALNNPLNRAADKDLSTTRLPNMMLELEQNSVEEFGSKRGQIRCLVYRAIYHFRIQYQQEGTNKKARTLADKSAKNITKEVKMKPLSVGTVGEYSRCQVSGSAA